ncbi:MAG: PIN domain-containing protein [Thermoanaerobaculia bacterium]
MIAVDSSVVIAGLLSWHEFHQRALHALEKAIVGRRLLIPLPVLVESYSVMTRLPSPHRLRPEIAHQLLHDSFGDARVVGLSHRKAWTFLGDCVAAGTSGGRVYDAVIAAAAGEARARELLTFKPRDFEVFSDRIAIIVP